MRQILNKLAIGIFDLMSLNKGYRFKRVRNEREYADACNVYNEDGFRFPDELKDKVASYKAGTINFIAYYKNMPVGMVRLADPNVNNRPYELYGVDVSGEHYEIQSLVVKKEYRDGSQFVMLGLFKAMYVYSVANEISSWSSCGARSVYLTMRRFCKKIEASDVDFGAIMHPLTQYLFANKIIDTYFTMEVADFEPWEILKKCVRQLSKKWRMPEFLTIKKPVYESLGYGSK